MTSQGLIIDSIEHVSDGFFEGNIRRIVIEAFTSHLSVFFLKRRADVAIAARKTLQSMDSRMARNVQE
jgi:hypothetical protein